MKPVREVVNRDVIEDLWGAGYTILPRRRHPDPFHVPEDMVPQGRSYQWWHLVHDKTHFYRPASCEPSGWAPVPASRHDGYFMPAGHIGDIEVNGLGLFEKPKFEVDQERKEQISAAYKQTDDWMKKWGGEFSGQVTVGQQTELGKLDAVQTTQIGATKTIENTTAIPRDMVPYIAQIFEERDRIGNQYAQESRMLTHFSTDLMEEIYTKLVAASGDGKSEWPTLNAIILPYAIENVRKRITEEAASGQAS